MPAPGSRTATGPSGRTAAQLAALREEIVDHRFKGLPPDADGTTVGALAAERRNLFTGGFTTPVLALDAGHVRHNLSLMERWTRERGLEFAPHGKTSMAPQLFARQMEHGAWGITLAQPHQVRVARAFGFPRIFLANEVVDAAALRWISRELDADPAFELICYADSVSGVALMDEALREAGARRPVDVVVELAAGQEARTGARTFAECAAVAGAVGAAGTLRLVGVAGYEGEVPRADPERVTAWLRRLTALAAELDGAGWFRDAEHIVVSAGGSAWFDAVAEVFGRLPELSAPVRRLLRSGAYVSHDDGQYRKLTPFNRLPGQEGLRSALTLWAQVVSRPTPDRAFLNAGKRDASYDMHLPQPHTVRPQSGGAPRPAEGLAVTGLSDQHAWLRTGGGDGAEVGDWVGLGLSHPCTVFDRWPLIPLVESDGSVTDYVRTFF